MRAQAVVPRRSCRTAVLALLVSLVGLFGLVAPAVAQPVTYTGRVLRYVDSSPVSGAVVTASTYGGEELARTTSNAQGHYTLPGVEANGRVRVCAVQDVPADRRTLREACDSGLGATDNDLVMERVTPISGTVSSADGGRLPDSLGVVVYRHGYYYDFPWLQDGEAPVDPTTGRFALRDVPDGNYRLCAVDVGDYDHLVGCAGGTQIEDADDVLARGMPLAKSFVVPDAGRVEGALDIDPGATPVTDGRVVAAAVISDGRGGVRELYGTERVVSDGTYSLDLAPGRYRILFFPAGDSPLLEVWNGGAATFDAAADVVVTSGGSSTVDLAVPVGASISGRVAPRGDERYPSVGVSDSTGAVSTPDVRSDGTYAVRGLRAGSYRVELGRDPGVHAAAELYSDVPESAGAGAATAVVVTAGEQRTGVDGMLSAGATVTGRLVDAAGNPVKGARARAYTDDDHLTERSALTTDSGTFSIAGLQSSAYKIAVEAPAFPFDISYYLDVSDHLSTVRPAATSRAVPQSGLSLGELRLPAGTPADPPQSIYRPRIVGSPGVGSPLTVTPGTWDMTGLSFSYRWMRTSDLDERPIPGATGATYTPTVEDVGHRLFVDVSASKVGTREGFSHTDETAALTLRPRIVSTVAPTLSRLEPKVGQTVSVNGGAWSATPTSTTYQWYRDDTPIKGATLAAYVPIAADLGERLSVVEVARRGGYDPGSANVRSAPTVAGTPLTTTNTVRPVIGGTPRVGSTLSAGTGTWTPAGALTFDYLWYVGGVAVPGATTSTYVPTASDVRKQVTVRVAGSRPGAATAYAFSAPTSAVAPPAFAVTVPPSIAGTGAVGSRLSYVRGQVAPAPRSFRLQWLRNGVPTGMTSQGYTVVAADRGKTLSLRVTYSRLGYTSLTLTTTGIAIPPT